MSAAPIGMPGCPLFACCTASAARKRMVSMHFLVSSGDAAGTGTSGRGGKDRAGDAPDQAPRTPGGRARRHRLGLASPGPALRRAARPETAAPQRWRVVALVVV